MAAFRKPAAKTPLPPPTRFAARERFLHANRYRAEREWKRYEGTAQRDLFRTLRERFLERHTRAGRWVLDIGSGAGRFTPWIRKGGSRAIALDLSREALRLMEDVWSTRGEAGPLPDRVRGDARSAPFPPGMFGTVAVLGNLLGFAGTENTRLLQAAQSLAEPEGVLVLEIAPGPGERSRYLGRLPKGSVARLLRSPTRAVMPRVEREGFRVEGYRKDTEGAFLRIDAEELSRELTRAGWEITEVIAVAPALGPDLERLEAVRPDTKAWNRLLTLEEELGRQPDRWKEAAAVLIAARGSASKRGIK